MRDTNYTAPLICGKVGIVRHYAPQNLIANCPITRLSPVFDHGGLKAHGVSCHLVTLSVCSLFCEDRDKCEENKFESVILIFNTKWPIDPNHVLV